MPSNGKADIRDRSKSNEKEHDARQNRYKENTASFSSTYRLTKKKGVTHSLC